LNVDWSEIPRLKADSRGREILYVVFIFCFEYSLTNLQKRWT